jgi:hypothetical protein
VATTPTTLKAPPTPERLLGIGREHQPGDWRVVAAPPGLRCIARNSEGDSRPTSRCQPAPRQPPGCPGGCRRSFFDVTNPMRVGIPVHPGGSGRRSSGARTSNASLAVEISGSREPRSSGARWLPRRPPVEPSGRSACMRKQARTRGEEAAWTGRMPPGRSEGPSKGSPPVPAMGLGW